MRLSKSIESIDGKRVLVLDDFLCQKMGIDDGSVLELTLQGNVLSIMPQENRIDSVTFEKVLMQGMSQLRSVLEVMR